MHHLLTGGNNHVIIKISQRSAQIPEAFSDLTFNAISLRRTPSTLQRDSEPEMREIVFDSENSDFRKPDDFTGIEKATVLPPIVEPSLVIQMIGN